jgi:biotin carboxyl carrier protein
LILEATVDGRTLKVEIRARNGGYLVVLDGRGIEVDFFEAGPPFMSLLIDGRSHEAGVERTPEGYRVVLPDDVLVVELTENGRGAAALARRAGSGPLEVKAPMPGKIVRVLVEPGQEAVAGQGIVVVEAMKMENELRASRGGRVKDVLVHEGQAVENGALLVVLE